MSQKKGVDKATIRLYWQAALRHRRYLLFASLYPIGAICISTLVPLFIGKTLATLATPNDDPAKYIPYLIVAAVIGLSFNRTGFKNLLSLQAAAMNDLQAKALDTLLKRSIGFHSNNIGGKLVSDATDFPAGYSQLSSAVFVTLIPMSVILISGSIIIFAESWILGLFISVMSITTVGWGAIESRGRSHLRLNRLMATKAVTGHLADTVLNVQTVKTFARESSEQAEHDRLGKNLLDQRVKDWALAATQGTKRMAVLMAIQLAFVICVIELVQSNPALLGIGIFAFSFTITLSNKLFEINNVIRSIEDGLLAASPMTEIILEEAEITDKPNAKPLRVTDGRLELKNVDFKYHDDNSSQSVFSQLSLGIAPGEKVGLVGPSGGGKSTFTRLLLRFEDIDGGAILVDGQNIADITQTSLRRSISYVPQEPLLFHRTVRENIAYGNEKAGDKAVENAARLAHADEFVKKLPKGYQTTVGERGVKLSGGQRQRIAIARAILKDAPILVLDEATSALDSESEVLIQDALWKLMEGRTTIVIAHRLSTIQKMDRIIVLDDGKIVEQGSHTQLLHKKGTYARLWAHQSGGFIEE
ncbi:MAG TPA: ABC transporter ATP-binding protein [Candidatus Saccharimonadales bacterium]